MMENWRTWKLIVQSQGEKDVSLHFLLNSESPPERQEQELEKKGKFSPAILSGAVFTFVLVQNILCIESKKVQKHN